MPADALFHFPDPALPLSWPFAYAPPIETRTIPSRPILPETLAPEEETLPSVMVSVERVSGSQLPVFVTTFTFQRPSYGVCAVAGTAVRAEVARVETKNRLPMRLRRMNSDPRYVRCRSAFPETMCSKFGAPRHQKNLIVNQIIGVKL